MNNLIRLTRFQNITRSSVIKSKNSLLKFSQSPNICINTVRCLYTPNDAFQKQGSYEGPGKTTVSILNDEYAGVVNLIDSYAVDGFRLNDNTKILGPCIVFPTQVLLWNVDGPEEITEDSLALFTVLDPKIDVLLIGYGDTPKKGEKFPVDTSVIMKMRKKGVTCELLTTENAIATYNFLVEEGRVVAAALIPPNQVKLVAQDVIDTKARRKQLYGDGSLNWVGGSNRGEHPFTGEKMLPKSMEDQEKDSDKK